ncbi:MAG: hypothetical protein RMK32_10360, partial [Anaerolineae bacterium]|nr:hypothetical protein [Anaerolineae bacterium]
ARDYAMWKHSLLASIVHAPREIVVLDPRTGKAYRHIRFDTRTMPELAWYDERFYHNARKRVPANIANLLTELALAVWYMDDGHRRRDCNALRLNTHAFSCEEVECLRDALWNRFGIRSKLHRVVETQWVLYIPSREAVPFCQLIRRYIPPSMEYKLL